MDADLLQLAKSAVDICADFLLFFEDQNVLTEDQKIILNRRSSQMSSDLDSSLAYDKAKRIWTACLQICEHDAEIQQLAHLVALKPSNAFYKASLASTLADHLYKAPEQAQILVTLLQEEAAGQQINQALAERGGLIEDLQQLNQGAEVTSGGNINLKNTATASDRGTMRGVSQTNQIGTRQDDHLRQQPSSPPKGSASTSRPQKEVVKSMKAPINLFYAYAQNSQDAEMFAELEKHLITLQQSGDIVGWHKGEINAGQRWRQETEKYLNTAQVILLLLSADFFASSECYRIMQQALQRYRQGKAYVIPILLRPVFYENMPIASLQVVPKNGKPVASWEQKDEAFLDIVAELRKVLH